MSTLAETLESVMPTLTEVALIVGLYGKYLGYLKLSRWQRFKLMITNPEKYYTLRKQFKIIKKDIHDGRIKSIMNAFERAS